MIDGNVHSCAELLSTRYDNRVSSSQTFDYLYLCIGADTSDYLCWFSLPRAIDKYFVFTHFGYNGLRRNGQCILVFLFLQCDGGVTAWHDAAGIGIEGTYGQCVC